MHLGSLERTQEARVALGCCSSNSYASSVLSKLPACIHRTLSMNKFLITVRCITFSSRIAIGKQTITFYATNCNTATYNFAFKTKKKKPDKLGLEKPTSLSLE